MAKSTRRKTTRKKPASKKPCAKKSAAEMTEGSRIAAASMPQEAVESHRLRQASVAKILDEVFGAFRASDPKLWERRAYLLLVGSVYERLATDAELSTDELVKLARVLAESRRSKSTRVSATPQEDRVANDPSSVDGNGQLPDRFADMIRDLYGASLGDDQSSTSEDTLRHERGGVGG